MTLMIIPQSYHSHQLQIAMSIFLRLMKLWITDSSSSWCFMFSWRLTWTVLLFHWICFLSLALHFQFLITGCDATTNKLHHYTIYYNYIIYYLLMCIYNQSLHLYKIVFFLIRCKIMYSMFQ